MDRKLLALPSLVAAAAIAAHASADHITMTITRTVGDIDVAAKLGIGYDPWLDENHLQSITVSISGFTAADHALGFIGIAPHPWMVKNTHAADSNFPGSGFHNHAATVAHDGLILWDDLGGTQIVSARQAALDKASIGGESIGSALWDSGYFQPAINLFNIPSPQPPVNNWAISSSGASVTHNPMFWISLSRINISEGEEITLYQVTWDANEDAFGQFVLVMTDPTYEELHFAWHVESIYEPPAFTGACCVDFTCEITTEAKCVGEYLGDHTTCLGDPCAPPMGACCVDFTCAVTTPWDCEGEYLGDDTTCDDDPCAPPPTGACCVDFMCSITTEDKCAGEYLGDDTVCFGNPCAPPTDLTLNIVHTIGDEKLAAQLGIGYDPWLGEHNLQSATITLSGFTNFDGGLGFLGVPQHPWTVKTMSALDQAIPGAGFHNHVENVAIFDGSFTLWNNAAGNNIVSARDAALEKADLGEKLIGSALWDSGYLQPTLDMFGTPGPQPPVNNWAISNSGDNVTHNPMFWISLSPVPFFDDMVLEVYQVTWSALEEASGKFLFALTDPSVQDIAFAWHVPAVYEPPPQPLPPPVVQAHFVGGRIVATPITDFTDQPNGEAVQAAYDESGLFVYRIDVKFVNPAHDLIAVNASPAQPFVIVTAGSVFNTEHNGGPWYSPAPSENFDDPANALDSWIALGGNLTPFLTGEFADGTIAGFGELTTADGGWTTLPGTGGVGGGTIMQMAYDFEHPLHMQFALTYHRLGDPDQVAVVPVQLTLPAIQYE